MVNAVRFVMTCLATASLPTGVVGAVGRRVESDLVAVVDLTGGVIFAIMCVFLRLREQISRLVAAFDLALHVNHAERKPSLDNRTASLKLALVLIAAVSSILAWTGTALCLAAMVGTIV